MWLTQTGPFAGCVDLEHEKLYAQPCHYQSKQANGKASWDEFGTTGSIGLDEIAFFRPCSFIRKQLRVFLFEAP